MKTIALSLNGARRVLLTPPAQRLLVELPQDGVGGALVDRLIDADLAEIRGTTLVRTRGGACVAQMLEGNGACEVRPSAGQRTKEHARRARRGKRPWT
jgi:hypothetical protein